MVTLNLESGVPTRGLGSDRRDNKLLTASTSALMSLIFLQHAHTNAISISLLSSLGEYLS